MLRNLFKFELAFHLKSVGFWLTVVVMIGFGLLLSTDFASLSNEGGSRVKNNGAVPIALSMSFMSLAGILFGAVFVVGGIMRDDTFKSVEIIHATPVSTFNMVISRMMAAWIVVTLCISAVVIGLIAGQFMPWADAESYGPNNPLYFLQPLVVFTLINSLLLTAIYTAIATLTRDKAMVYVSAIGVLVLYIGATFVGGGNAPDWLAPILDPFGTAALGEIVQFWPAAEQNERLVPLNSYVGLNRLLWGGISLALFVFSFLRSTRGIPTRKTKAGEYDNVAPTKDIELHPVTPQLNGGYHFASFARQLRHDYMRTIQSVPFIILSGIAVILFGIVLIGTVILNPDPTIATSTFMARTVVGALAIPMLIIMVFFGGDILWRERTAGIHEILDATPVSNGSLLSAKWISLSLVLWTMIAVGIIFGMVAQLILSGGQTVVNPWIYLKTGLLGFGISFALQAFLVMFIQNFMPNRITGMLVSGAVIFGLTFFVTRLPFFHPLMDYGSVSPGNLSEMSGYANLSRFKNFGIYWGSLALLLAIVSIWVFRRGLQDGLGARLKNMRANMRVPSIALAVAALAGFIGMGTVIHGAYEDGEYRNLKQREQRVVDYEKLVKSHEDDPQPEVTSVSADVQFFPKKREAVVSGTMTLFNPHDAPLREFILKDPVESDEDIRALVVVGATEVSGETYADAVKTYDYRIMRFDTPLPAGGEATLSFETFYHAPRLGDGSVVVANGTFVNNTQVMPQIGYVDGYQENPDKRRKFDLPEKERMPERDDMEARQDNFFDAHSHYVDFNATVCTDAGQIGIAPGEMTRKYDGQDGRSCRDYKAIQPIANFFSFMSGDYVVASDTWNAPDGRTIPLEIFHYADHVGV